jgi:hypothetical protein
VLDAPGVERGQEPPGSAPSDIECCLFGCFDDGGIRGLHVRKRPACPLNRTQEVTGSSPASSMKDLHMRSALPGAGSPWAP